MRTHRAREKLSMKVGLFVNTQFPEGMDVGARIPEMVEQVRAAKDAGFKSLWFPHHWLTQPLQMLQLSPVMAYVAAHAEGMTIGPNILILPPLNPVHVAEESATLDVLTGGNYILGIGLGYRPQEFTAFGVPLSERAPRFVESIGLMRRLWTEDKVDHEGRFYTVKDAGISLKPKRAGGPPLYIAGQVDVAVKRAARIGDAWLIVNSSGLGKIAPLMKTYRSALAEYKRTPVEYPITIECYVGENNATAHEECRGPLEYKYAAYASWGLEKASHTTSFEEFARDRFIIGDKVKVKEEIARYNELLGVDHFVMRCQWPGLEQQKVLGTIKRLGEIFA
jgi:alkanesulfonate monooxygenase SsuD/methylene tetrahydromethanopterin reductase-like flavin-dependent oxidoreductase (luciferase family)